MGKSFGSPPGNGHGRPIYSALMADPPDLSALAKRYVDLWQDQLIALAAHPELAEGLARVLAAFPIPTVSWPAPSAGPPHNGYAAPGPAPVAAAPGGGDRELREL